MDDERMRRELDLAAGEIDAGDAAGALAVVRSTMRGRRRRRQASAAVAVAGLLAGGTVMVMSIDGSDGDDLLRSAPPSSTIEPTTTLAAEAAAGEPTTTAAQRPAGSTTAQVVDVPVVDVQPTSLPALGSADGTVAVEWLLPWNDGFLAGASRTQPQPLPSELPPEVQELFSTEVQELFAGGLPATVNEATAMLTDAGLLDEVTAVLAANPDVNDLIFDPRRQALPPAVWFTVDGEQWSPVDFALPEGTVLLQQVTVGGDRLVAVDTRPGAEGNTIVVASTTDLTNWETQTIDVARPAGLPDALDYSAWPSQIAANESGWVLEVSAYVEAPAIDSLLPAEAQDLLAGSSYGGGMSSDASGVEIEVITSADGDSETLSYTWDELGIDPAVVPHLNTPGGTELWAAPFGGAPVKAQSGPGFGSPVVALSDRFVRWYPALETSADGLVWTAVDVPWDREFVNDVLPLESGMVVFTEDEFVTSKAYRVDSTFTDWTPIDIPGAPEWFGSSYGRAAGTPAAIVDSSRPDTGSQVAVIEYDGFVLSIGGGRVNIWYELVDLSTGEIVASESIDLAARAGDRTATRTFEHLSYDNDGGVTVFDPASGAVLLDVPEDVLTKAYEDAYGGGEIEEYQPDLWLIAAIGDNRWLVDDLDDDPDADGPSVAAINGDLLLVTGRGGWLRYDTGS